MSRCAQVTVCGPPTYPDIFDITRSADTFLSNANVHDVSGQTWEFEAEGEYNASSYEQDNIHLSYGFEIYVIHLPIGDFDWSSFRFPRSELFLMNIAHRDGRNFLGSVNMQVIRIGLLAICVLFCVIGLLRKLIWLQSAPFVYTQNYIRRLRYDVYVH